MKKFERDSGPPPVFGGANLGIPLSQYISALFGVDSRHQYHRLHMPWDNGVDKKAHINDVATTVIKKPMPLTTCDGAAVIILWSRQTRV